MAVGPPWQSAKPRSRHVKRGNGVCLWVLPARQIVQILKLGTYRYHPACGDRVQLPDRLGTKSWFVVHLHCCAGLQLDPTNTLA
ncbi:hypothetical protein VTJ04DRAFT_6988 [Mycothermus thermophilus]|uniref:uncharacterized protein n=1 Tax=Humicola insolens TaxID=85995 RepID=UPI0037448878